jgi:hypothetical protein
MSGTNTCYLVLLFDSDMYIQKRVSGTNTNLTNKTVSISLPDTIKIQSSGTSQNAWLNVGDNVSATDSAISGNTNPGLWGRSTSTAFGGYTARGDNFEAADLFAGSPYSAYAQQQ